MDISSSITKLFVIKRGAQLYEEEDLQKLSLRQNTKHFPALSQLLQRRIELVEILRDNDCKGCFPEKLKHCPDIFSSDDSFLI